MKDTVISNIESQFVVSAIADRLRLDGRGVYDVRDVEITFGNDRGCCLVKLGKTCVLAQVSCEMAEPTVMRSSEGRLFLNVELSPIASPGFVDRSNKELAVMINRMLEKCIHESKAVDLESLCIIAGEKVWHIRVDLQVLCHEGNMLDCACIAAMASLSHFRRPDVTVDSGEVTVHAVTEREPVPLSVLHFPFTVSVAFFLDGKQLVVDPGRLEEEASAGGVVVGMNRHGEICCLQATGNVLLSQQQVEGCVSVAGVKVVEITKQVQEALAADSKTRASGAPLGFAASLKPARVTAAVLEPHELPMEDLVVEGDEEQAGGRKALADSSAPEKMQLVSEGVVGLGGEASWQPIELDSDSQSGSGSSDVEIVSQETISKRRGRASREAEVIISSGSEEEEVVTLTSEQLKVNAGKKKS